MSIFRSAVRHLSAVAAASFLLGAAPASAAVIAIFDPAFGPTIPNLGFRGTVTFDVAPACYTLGTGFVFTGGACQITALSSQINFYNASTNPNNVLTTVALDASYFASNYVFGAYFDPATNQLAGVDSRDSAPFAFSVMDSNANFPVNFNGSMVLDFASGHGPLVAGISVAGAYLRNCERGQGTCTGTTSNPAAVRFTTVPEPDGITLAALGLGALVFARRRTRTAHGRSAARS